MSTVLLNFINSQKSRDFGMMLLFSKGRVYWLYNHHLVIDPEDSLKVLLGRGEAMKGARPSNRNPRDKVIYLY